MGPTLLSLIGLDNVNPMLGADLTQRDPNCALMQYADNFGYLQGDKLLVLEPAKAPREFRYRAAPVGQDETYEPVEPVDEALSRRRWRTRYGPAGSTARKNTVCLDFPDGA